MLRCRILCGWAYSWVFLTVVVAEFTVRIVEIGLHMYVGMETGACKRVLMELNGKSLASLSL